MTAVDEIPEGVDQLDVVYFQQRLVRSIERNEPIELQNKIRAQLALLEDTVVIYHEHRPGETKSGS